jgi:tRNA(Arg) A34 adenosine deaminase TadA
MDFVLELALRPDNDNVHIAALTTKRFKRVVAFGLSRRTAEGFSHAETNAIREFQKCHFHPRYKYLCLISVRARAGLFRQAKPCAHCVAAIKQHPAIKRVAFSNGCGMEVCKTKHLFNDHVSMANRQC